MLKRLFISWLALSILSIGISFAGGIHSENYSDHNHQSSLVATDHVTDNDINEHDHECHISIHLLGINSQYEFNILELSNKIKPFYTSYSPFILPTPIFHPPITI